MNGSGCSAVQGRRDTSATERADMARRRTAVRVAMADVLASRAAMRDSAAERLVAGHTVLDAVRAQLRGVPADAVPRPDPAGHTARTLQPLRVLVVDDLVPLRRLLVRQLTHAGHQVVGEAGTAADAVTYARALLPDVVLLDVHLPDGFGTDVAGSLGSGHAERRPAVVFCTGDVDGAFAVGAGCAVRCGGRWTVLEKPASTAVLDAAVREAAARIYRVQ